MTTDTSATGVGLFGKLTPVGSMIASTNYVASGYAAFVGLNAAGSMTATFAATTTPMSRLRNLLGDDPGLNRLYDNVLLNVPGSTLPLVQVAAWNAIEDFYLRSTAKRVVLYWTMAVGVQQLDFNPYDENWLVAWVLQVSGMALFQVIPPAVLMDRTNPVAVRNGAVLLALKPVTSGNIDDPLLFQQWFETILAGTLSRLYMMPSKPWSSPQLAQFYGRTYRGDVAKARAIADAAYTNGPGIWRVPYYAMGRRKS